MICQATVGTESFPAWDSCAEWCNAEAVTTVPLTLIPMLYPEQGRLANVWLCQEHYDEFVRHYEI